MFNIAIIGAGRIAKVHANAIADNPKAKLIYVYDVYEPAATELAKTFNAIATTSVEQIFKSKDVNGIIIASSTETHLDLLTLSVNSNKPVLCEKPLDLDINKIHHALPQLNEYAPTIQIGFNRRFDPNHKALKESINNGVIGNLEQLIITSRDPSLPDENYIKKSGGIFRDMIIHDFDMARYITGEEMTELQVFGSCLVDKKLEGLNDLDSVMVMLKTESGRLVHINGSRRCSYGYDQRIEAFGSEGMLISNNPTKTTLTHFSNQNNNNSAGLYDFFLDRYANAYHRQLEEFISNQGQLTPTLDDGVKAQELAEAAYKSLKDKSVVLIDYK